MSDLRESGVLARFFEVEAEAEVEIEVEVEVEDARYVTCPEERASLWPAHRETLALRVLFKDKIERGFRSECCARREKMLSEDV